MITYEDASWTGSIYGMLVLDGGHYIGSLRHTPINRTSSPIGYFFRAVQSRRTGLPDSPVFTEESEVKAWLEQNVLTSRTKTRLKDPRAGIPRDTSAYVHECRLQLCHEDTASQ